MWIHSFHLPPGVDTIFLLLRVQLWYILSADFFTRCIHASFSTLRHLEKIAYKLYAPWSHAYQPSLCDACLCTASLDRAVGALAPAVQHAALNCDCEWPPPHPHRFHQASNLILFLVPNASLPQLLGSATTRTAAWAGVAARERCPAMSFCIK